MQKENVALSRSVPLSKGAKALMRSLDSIAHSPWVFPNPKNPLKPWNFQSFVNHCYSPYLQKADIQGACWHTLRHTAASRRVMAGVDLVSVQKFMGHPNIETTLRYAHLSPDRLRDAVASLDGFFSTSSAQTAVESPEPCCKSAASR